MQPQLTQIENFTLPDSLDPPNVITEITDSFPTVKERIKRKQRRLFDTFDWRLYNRGLILFKEGRTYYLYDIDQGHSIASSTPPEDTDLKFSWEFPRAPLRKTLEAIVDVRALLPLTNTDERIQGIRILNEDQKTVLRVQIEDVQATDTKGKAALAKSIKLVPVRGYVKELQEFKRFLSALNIVPLKGDSLSAALVTPDKRPGDYTSKLRIKLDHDDVAVSAVKKILSHLLRTIKQNEPGIKADIDTEFLHDFRVAVRRTRSALDQIKDVFPDKMVRRFSQDFEKIGKGTNRFRDLDVYLLRRNEYDAMLPESLRPGLGPVFEWLRLERRKEHQNLVETLASEGYRQTILSYENFILSDHDSNELPANANKPVLKLAQKFIRDAYEKVSKKGNTVDVHSPDSELHSLRIKCKKLRYLLEFFSSLFPRNEVGILVKQLKNLQGTLGNFNDFCVQQNSLMKLIETSQFGKDTRIVAAAVGGLVAILHQKQKQTRKLSADKFSEFESDKSKGLYRELFGIRVI